MLVDAKGQGNLLYLPLDKLMQAAGSVPAAAPAHTETNVFDGPASCAGHDPRNPAARADRPEVRTRDALRLRDRGALMKASLNFIAAAAAGVLVLLGAMIFTVDQRQHAIVFQLGEVREVISEPGLDASGR